MVPPKLRLMLFALRLGHRLMLFDLQLVPLCVWEGPFSGLGLPDRGRGRALTLAMSLGRWLMLFVVLQARLALTVGSKMYMQVTVSLWLTNLTTCVEIFTLDLLGFIYMLCLSLRLPLVTTTTTGTTTTTMTTITILVSRPSLCTAAPKATYPWA